MRRKTILSILNFLLIATIITQIAYTSLSTSITRNKIKESIKENLPNFKNDVESVLNNENANYKIEYGMNYFPEKNYKGIYYEEGEYESVVIQLGEGKGDSFWCVLFPPLCFLEGEESNSDEVECTSFIKELINS